MSNNLKVSNALDEVELLVEKVRVMVGDVNDDYFGYDLEASGELWRIAPPYYRTAEVKNQIAFDLIVDLDEKVKELRGLIN